MLPAITILIPTYARTGLLAEALESALRQDYQGVVEILVLNDCPWQQLLVDQLGRVGRIRVVNAPQRYPSLGAKRQAMLELAQTELITWLDDDDLIMPWYLSHLAAAATDQVDAVIPDCWFRLVQDYWSWEPMPGGMPMLARREAALQVGFDRALSTGEDNAHRKGLFARHAHSRSAAVLLGNATPAYCYRTPGTHMHISRSYVPGDPTRSVSPKAFWDEAAARMRAGTEPTNLITVRPHWKEDYWATLARLFPRDVPSPTIPSAGA
jgi:hypothetical protein